MKKKKVLINGVWFTYDSEKSQLISIENCSDDPVDIHVPREMPDGTIINIIGNSAFKGTFKKVSFDCGMAFKQTFKGAVIDTVVWPSSNTEIPRCCFYYACIRSPTGIDGLVKVGDMAFSGSEFSDFHWPAGAVVIPEQCFSFSKIKCFTGLENVTKVKESAFKGTEFYSFTWPSKAKVIPASCFGDSSIEYINGIENITTIGESAFSYSNIKEFTWPAKATQIPASCFRGCPNLKKIAGIENVKAIEPCAFEGSGITVFAWPKKVNKISQFCFVVSHLWPGGAKIVPDKCFYLSRIEAVSGTQCITDIGSSAFGKTPLASLDLSSNLIVKIGKGAFEGIGSNNIVKPFYIKEEDFADCF